MSTFCKAAQQRGARRGTATFIGLPVVLRSVNWARNASPSRTSGGRPLMICRSCVVCDRGLPGAEQAGGGVGDGDDAEGGQRVVERHVHHGLAVGVQHHGRGFHSSRVSSSSRVGRSCRHRRRPARPCARSGAGR
jgi:hypothetical protein